MFAHWLCVNSFLIIMTLFSVVLIVKILMICFDLFSTLIHRQLEYLINLSTLYIFCLRMLCVGNIAARAFTNFVFVPHQTSIIILISMWITHTPICCLCSAHCWYGIYLSHLFCCCCTLAIFHQRLGSSRIYGFKGFCLQLI